MLKVAVAASMGDNKQATPGTIVASIEGSYPVLKCEHIVVRIHQSRRHRSPATFVATSKGILITGACTRVSSFLHPIVRSSKN